MNLLNQGYDEKKCWGFGPSKKQFSKVMTQALMTEHTGDRVDSLGVLSGGYVDLFCFALLLSNNGGGGRSYRK